MPFAGGILLRSLRPLWDLRALRLCARTKPFHSDRTRKEYSRRDAKAQRTARMTEISRDCLGVLSATFGTPSGSASPLLSSGRDGRGVLGRRARETSLVLTDQLRCVALRPHGQPEENNDGQTSYRQRTRRTLQRARRAHVRVFDVSCALVCVAKGAAPSEGNWRWAHELRAETRRALRRAGCAHARVLTHGAHWFPSRRSTSRDHVGGVSGATRPHLLRYGDCRPDVEPNGSCPIPARRLQWILRRSCKSVT